MVMPTVWSERGGRARTATGRLTDCTYSANLMVLVYAGFRNFPLGIGTAAERNELETCDNRPDNTGATHFDTDVAIAKRYEVAMRTGPGGIFTSDALRAALASPGKAFAVAGSYGKRLPDDLRRWDPLFQGNHDVCVVPLGGGLVRWLDPLAPTGFGGDDIGLEIVVNNYAFLPNDARFLNENELGSLPDTAVPEEPMENKWLGRFQPVPQFIAVTAAGAKVYKGPGRDYEVHFEPPAGTRYHVVGVVDRSDDPEAQKPQVNSAGLWFLCGQPDFARPPGFFLANSEIAQRLSLDST